MDKAAMLSKLLEPSDRSTLLGGESLSNVIKSNKYIPAVTDLNLSSVDHALHTALSTAVSKPVVVLGSEGSGKSTAVKKLVLDWTKGEELDRFSFVFLFQFSEINLLKGEMSLETLLGRHHSPPASVQRMLEKPEEVLLVMDGLEEYQHSLDPSLHPLCTDPHQDVPVPCLVSSLLHGSLIKGAVFLLTTRPTSSLKSIDYTPVEVLGFLKQQREAYAKSFFLDAVSANTALEHMERTLGFYDFASSPRFCWTLCSVYKSLIDSRDKLPETISQLMVDVLVLLLQRSSLSLGDTKELMLALGKVASKCCIEGHRFTKEEIEPFSRQCSHSSVFLKISGELNSGGFAITFHSKLMQDFLSAVSFYLEKPPHNNLEEMLEELKESDMEVFLSGVSQPLQRKALEALLGEFSPQRIQQFRDWLTSSSVAPLEGFDRKEHLRYLRLLHQAQSHGLVKEMVTSSWRQGLSYGGALSLRDCVALNYVITSLAGVETLNLYQTANLTEEMARVLAPAMSLSHKINLSSCSLSVGSIQHLASALSGGTPAELDLSRSPLTGEQMKTLSSGLTDCQLQTINLVGCKLTEASCASLASALTSTTSDLRVLHISFNEIGDEGFATLSRALLSPNCILQNIQAQGCNLTAASLEGLSAALCSGTSQLREVNLTGNGVGDGGGELLFKALQNPLCKLHRLNLFDAGLSAACCPHLKETLMSEHCLLSHLDLSVNQLGQEGALLLCQALLTHPSCPLEKLWSYTL